MTELAIIHTATIQPIINLVTDAVTSAHTKRAYGRALTDFMVWHQQTGQTGFSKATVQAHVSALRGEGVSASSINQRLTAIRKLAIECADNGLIDHSAAQAIGRVEGVRKEGKRLGNWLTKAQAQKLLELPDVQTVKGLRDRAILAVLLGCGLRREECAGLAVEHIQQREGRWILVDLVGKRSKTRSVPMPSWCKAAIDTYCQAAGIGGGVLFRSMRRGDNLLDSGMTSQAVFDVVKSYAAQIGVDVRPHDLRRTFAKLAHKGSAPIEQIQLSLGHASVQTTERYIGVQQDLHSAPCDALGLKL
ncbi:MAG: tyrosine-type recombinase/integrase [Caldilineaceae bacterium]